MSAVNNTEEVNSLLDYSPVNSSLHNLPVNRIFMNLYRGIIIKKNIVHVNIKYHHSMPYIIISVLIK
jgi:hypothetical protein